MIRFKQLKRKKKSVSEPSQQCFACHFNIIFGQCREGEFESGERETVEHSGCQVAGIVEVTQGQSSRDFQWNAGIAGDGCQVGQIIRFTLTFLC